jgi:hypothetical protein
MPALLVNVVRYVSDDPQPGIVECVFIDAYDQSHFFHEKTAIVSAKNLLSSSIYPVEGDFECEIIEELTDSSGNSLARVCTERPWGIESLSGETSFLVKSSQVKFAT